MNVHLGDTRSSEGNQHITRIIQASTHALKKDFEMQLMSLKNESEDLQLQLLGTQFSKGTGPVMEQV